jgi:hypothetical protein
VCFSALLRKTMTSCSSNLRALAIHLPRCHKNVIMKEGPSHQLCVCTFTKALPNPNPRRHAWQPAMAPHNHRRGSVPPRSSRLPNPMKLARSIRTSSLTSPPWLPPTRPPLLPQGDRHTRGFHPPSLHCSPYQPPCTSPARPHGLYSPRYARHLGGVRPLGRRIVVTGDAGAQ